MKFPLPNPDWAKLPLFDRKGWKQMPFGTFAESINERVEPADAAEEIYVGLEHLDSQNLHIRRWGKGSDVIGTKLRFHKGDVIFGRRRAYQRKLAVAEFDGICSAHAMVLRAKPDMVLPEFLPLLMMSDRFMNRAVEISVGSLSPTINWTTLKFEEFDLPPLDQQRRIAVLFGAVDEYEKRAWNVVESLQSFIKSELAHILSVGLRRINLKETEIGPIPSTWSLFQIRDLVAMQEHALLAGPFGTIFKAKDFRSEGVRIIQLRHVSESGFIWGENETYMDLGVYKRIHTPYTVCPGDLLITKMGEPPGIACIYPANGPLAMVTPDVIKATIDESVADVRFLKYLYNSSVMRSQIRRLIKGATRSRVSLNEFFCLKLPVPPIDEQKEIAEIVESFESCCTASKNSARDSSKLLMQLVGAII